MLRLQGIAKSIQGQLLFEQVDLVLQPGERWGVIGVNGCGKSSLLKIMGGLLEPDAGTRWVAEGYHTGYLAQEPEGGGEWTVAEAVYQGQAELLQLWARYQEVCKLLESDATPALLRELSELQSRLEHAGFFQLQVRADIALRQLGLYQLEQPVHSLSGGQRRRVALAQVLTRQPDVLLLDEPTNHLDTASIDWLEGYLRGYAGAVVMVTHDRYFLDRITNRTLEIDSGRVQQYQGNYAQYLERKSEEKEQALASAAKRANLWRRELEWLRRGPRARATKQKARIERAEALRPESGQVEARLEIQLAGQRLGRKVLQVQGLSKAFGENKILDGFDMVLEPQDRLGIIGPNGSGKTTLLELLAGRLTPDRGEVDWGSTVKLGYFDQENRELDPQLKVIDSVREVAESIPLSTGEVITAAQMCERFLFSGRLQHTLVGKLSGGERRRLHLLRVLMGNPNVLFLDEPSNDLDIPTLSCLEDYLDGFNGSLVVSSHDRYFLDRCVDQLLAFEGRGNPRRVIGGYSDYRPPEPGPPPQPVIPSAPTRSAPPAAADPGPSKARKLSFKEKRELEELEGRIAAGELRQSELEKVLAEQASNASAVQKAHAELEQLQAQLERDVERWAELAELAS